VFSGVKSVEHPQPELHRTLVSGAVLCDRIATGDFLGNSDIPRPSRRDSPGVPYRAPHQLAKL